YARDCTPRVRIFFFTECGDTLMVHSFPTRRSSDLIMLPVPAAQFDEVLAAPVATDRTSDKQKVDPWGPWYLANGSTFCLSLVRSDRKSTRLNSSHVAISYAVFCLKKKTQYNITTDT